MNINLDDLKKSHGNQASEIFKRVAEISGAGDPGNHDGGIDISGLSDAKKAQIDRLINPEEAEKAESKKEGKK